MQQPLEQYVPAGLSLVQVCSPLAQKIVPKQVQPVGIPLHGVGGFEPETLQSMLQQSPFCLHD